MTNDFEHIKFERSDMQSYLSGSMPMERRSLFEKKLNADPELKEEFELFKLFYISMQEIPASIIHDRLSENPHLQNHNQNGSFDGIFVWIALIIIIAGICVIVGNTFLDINTGISDTSVVEGMTSFGNSNEMGQYGDRGFAVAFTKDQDIILGGEFINSINVGEFDLNSPYGGQSLFLASIKQDFTVNWAFPFGGKLKSDWIYKIAVNSNNHILVSGRITEAAQVKDRILDIKGFRASGPEDLYLMELDQNGELSWILHDGADYSLQGQAGGGQITDIAFSETDDIYISGGVGGPSILNTPIKVTGDANTFFGKVDNSGNVKWLESIYGNYGVNTYAITVHGESIYLGGMYGHHNLDGDIQFPGESFRSVGGRDVFLAKYNVSGKFIWAKSFGSSERGNFGNEFVKDLVIDSDGNLLACGVFTNHIQNEEFELTANGNRDIFIMKINPNGEIEWVISAGGDENIEINDRADDSVTAIACDAQNNVFIAGRFSQHAIFESVEIFSNGEADGYLAKYNPQGKLLWVRQFGGAENLVYTDGVGDLSTDEYGRSYITGFFSGTMSIQGISLTAKGSRDIFVAVFDAQGQLLRLNAVVT